MYEPDLYRRTLSNVRKDQPDFYLMLGDDFSVDPLIARGQLSQQNVDRLYIDQRQSLGGIPGSVTLFLVDGNHEQAARYLLKGTADSAPLFSGRARTAELQSSGRYDGVLLEQAPQNWWWVRALAAALDRSGLGGAAIAAVTRMYTGT